MIEERAKNPRPAAKTPNGRRDRSEKSALRQYSDLEANCCFGVGVDVDVGVGWSAIMDGSAKDIALGRMAMRGQDDTS